MIRIKKATAIIMMMLLGVTAMGCSKKEDSNGNQTAGNSTVESVKTEGAESNTDDTTKKQETTDDIQEGENDTEFTDRVIASSVAVVQILDALEVPMVGVPTSSYELPESVADATRIGSAMEPDMEIIASLEPSVVVSVDSLSEDLKTQFETLGIESSFVNLSSYDGLIDSIASLGERFDRVDTANELIAGLEEKEVDVLAKIEGKEAPSVLIIFGAGQSFMVATEDSYVGDLAKHVGAVNVLQDVQGSFIPVDMEYLADKNPEYILLMAHANPEESLAALQEEFETNAAWQNFDAVKNGNVFALDTDYFGMSANLLAADAMDQLADILYTE